jgi:DNA modification methylase
MPPLQANKTRRWKVKRHLFKLISLKNLKVRPETRLMAQAKLQEEVERKKEEGFEDIDQAIPPEAHTPMYNVHRYFARKPHNVVRAYIEKYSKEKDIVLDPFCGSGVTISEALKAHRNAVGIDLDPMATFITKMTIKPSDISKFEKAFHDIEDVVKDQINSLYITHCRKCNKKLPALIFVWDKGKPIKVGYECPNCEVKTRKNVDEADLKLVKRVESMHLPPHPSNKLYYKNGLPFKEKQKYESVDEIFTRRNLLALSLLLQNIRKIQEPNTKELMEYAFTSISHLASRMTPDRPTRPFSSFWGQHSYWYAQRFMESNVWSLFEGRILDKQGVIRGKEESNKEISDYREGKTFEDILKGKSNALIVTQSCIDALRKFPPESVDYIFTDPPYAQSIQYAELTFMWGSWLGFDSDFNERVADEIVINHSQRKGFDEYYNMILMHSRKSIMF